MRTARRIDALLRQHQPLNKPTMHQMLRDNLVHILRRHMAIPDRLRIHHHGRPMLALVQTPGLIRPNRVL